MAELEGITVNGEPLKVYVEKEERREVEEVRQDIIRFHRKSIPRIIKYKPKLPSTTHSRPMIWGDETVRRRYGIMAKPFASKTENILWLIQSKGPITAAQMTKETSFTPNTVRSILTNLMQSKGDLIRREGTPFQYSLSKAMTMEELKAYRKPRGVIPKEATKTQTPSLPSAILQELKVWVNVSGRIDFIFGFQKAI